MNKSIFLQLRPTLIDNVIGEPNLDIINHTMMALTPPKIIKPTMSSSVSLTSAQIAAEALNCEFVFIGGDVYFKGSNGSAIRVWLN